MNEFAKDAKRARKREYMRKARASAGGSYAFNKAWNNRNREKYLAHKSVENALVSGALKRSPCVICGAKAQAHHEDYSKRLTVVWLCPTHHKARHKDMKNGNADSISHLGVLVISQSEHPPVQTPGRGFGSGLFLITHHATPN